MEVHPISLVVLICSNTGDGLTYWMCVPQSHQWFWSAQTLETHLLNKCSTILVNDSDLLKHWRGTHLLDRCSSILISGSDLLKHRRATHNLFISYQFLICSNTGWRGTHSLDGCSSILISDSDILNSWSTTYILDVFSMYLISKTHIRFYNLTNSPFKK